MRASFIPVILAALALPAAAQAQERAWEREVRVGVMQHDILHLGNGFKESGVDVEVQALSRQIGWLKFVGRPRGYVSASVNSDGDTSFAAVGVAWTKRLSDRWDAEYQFGYAVHDGLLDTNDPAEANSHLLLGSRDLFRHAAGMDYRVSDDWSLGLQWVHLSHGEILGEGRNQGIDAVGLRVGRRF